VPDEFDSREGIGSGFAFFKRGIGASSVLATEKGASRNENLIIHIL
jgi:hypothetical protein